MRDEENNHQTYSESLNDSVGDFLHLNHFVKLMGLSLPHTVRLQQVQAAEERLEAGVDLALSSRAGRTSDFLTVLVVYHFNLGDTIDAASGKP